MRISDVLTSVQALLPAEWTFATGAHAVREAGAPPRVVWVPVGGNIAPPTPQGYRDTTNPRPLWTRSVNLVAHVWGPDFEATEDMVEAIARALYATCSHHSVQLTSEQWVAEDATARLGDVCLLGFTLAIPVTREPDLTVRLADFRPVTTEIQR